MPVIPPATDKNVCVRTDMRGVCQKFNFSNRSIIKGDTAIFVKQSWNPFFTQCLYKFQYVNSICKHCKDRFSFLSFTDQDNYESSRGNPVQNVWSSEPNRPTEVTNLICHTRQNWATWTRTQRIQSCTWKLLSRYVARHRQSNVSSYWRKMLLNLFYPVLQSFKYYVL